MATAWKDLKREHMYERLQHAHAALPHLRLGQLLLNASYRTDSTVSLFYLPDEELVRMVEAYVEKADGL